MKFLEVMTSSGYEVLIPVNNIKYILKKYYYSEDGPFIIKIVSDSYEIEEFCSCEEDANNRYDDLKKMLKNS